MFQKFVFCLAFFCCILTFGQVPFTNIATSNASAERVAKFGVDDVANDFLEITNSTQFANSFIPSIWAHQQSDNRFVMRLFATTNSGRDNGTTPIMIFRAELRNNLNFNAPSGGTFPWGIVSGEVNNRPLFAWENGNTQLMRLMSNGFLGLGTTNPSALFHSVGTLRFQNLPNGTNPTFILGTDSSGNVFEYDLNIGGVSDSDWLKLDSTSPDSVANDIFTNGNVGINTQSPTANLHSNGTVRFENLTNQVANPAFILGTDSSGNVFEYDLNVGGSSDSDWLKLDNTSPDSVIDNIYTNGKVGVNVTSFPNTVGSEDVSFYNLFVAGGILTEEVRIAPVSDWADYVFKKEYNLPTIEQVEDYIKENGHLMNIPSEKDVKNNGVELGEMNKLLLEKIEELTLYVIELNKRVIDQQEQIEVLKSKTK